MKRIYSTFLMVIMPVLSMAHSKNVIYKKTIQKDYTVSDKALLHLGNKYGKIILHTWDKNEIKATIVVTGYGKDQDEAEDIANLVDIDASQGENGGDVSISTSYNKPSQGFSSLWHLIFGGGSGDTKGYVNIDYEVYLPSSLRMLNVEDNYGDVSADAISSPCDISINYCNYDFNSITAPLKLHMNYCKGTITKAGVVTLSANYSTLDNEEAGSINTSSNYSNYHLSKIGTFSLSSNYDDVNIEQLNDIRGESDYTHYHIGELDSSADMHITYGDFKVDKLGKDFRSIMIESSYGGAFLGVDPKAVFRLDAHLSYGELKTGGIDFKDVNSVTRSNNKDFTGVTDGGNDTSPLIRFQGSYADLVLRSE